VIGGLLGTFIYIFFVGSHLQDEEEELELLRRSMDSADWKSMLVIPKKTGKRGVSLINPYTETHQYPGGLNNNGFVITGENLNFRFHER